ncbi:histone H1.8 isoform X1 [Pongo pygmaeus]|uniref:histone H1.8 isoform X1 n=2 Tax=Pongo abelii TaxID=9601 RepID=UPI0023E1ED40|nr:histone H1.8 isoform X1 [Pongo abelii]XP_054338185.1 histone H1.8 isoform X1 [Pongo pygmaeus]
MASGSVTSDISPSSTSTAGSSRSPESEKPGEQEEAAPPSSLRAHSLGPSHSSLPVGRRHPPVLRMVLEALQAGEQRRGTSVAAIKLYILHKYPTVDVLRFKYLLKQALATGMRRGLLARPLNSKARGATGSFKLVPKHKGKIQPRKMAPPTAPRRAGEAKGKGPKKPSEAKEDPPNVGKVKKAAKRPAKVQKAPPKPGAATEKPRKQGGAAKDTRAQSGEARKVPPKPDKAMRAPSSTGRLSRKAKAKGSRSSQGDAEAYRKTKAESKSSKPTASKVKNGAASPTKKKVVAKAKAPKAPKANTKAAAPAKGSGSKVVPAHLSRKTEAPKGPRKAGLPIKASSSKVSSQRAEA